MCGITGYITKKEFDNDVIKSMRDKMAHRGPDGEGVFYDNQGDTHIALAHRRLSIIDISERGKQPMITKDGKVAITFNGEIYNYKQIRSELVSLGHKFDSTCDTEVVLHSYMQWGIQSVKKFRGMFAYAIYDKEVNKLFLVRDRMGEKPLYYMHTKDELVFASELVAIMQYPDFEKEIDQRVLQGYLWNMYIPAPYSIFKGVKKLQSGHIFSYNVADGTTYDDLYWNVDDNYLRYSNETEGEITHHLERLIEDSIKEKLVADVPVGVFLSGGIDSSIIAAIAQKVSEKPIDTFSIGFNEKGKDEAIYSKEIARHLGTKHHEMYCTLQDAIEIVKKIPSAYSEPFADNSQIPMLMLSEFARKHVTVALSGDGGDELFYGYPWDKRIVSYNKYKNLAKITKFVPQIGPLGNVYSREYWKMMKFEGMSKDIFSIDRCASERMIATMFEYPNYELGELYHQKPIGYGTLEEQLLNLELKNSLQEDMLTKVDRATMAYSLESRAPFLDHRIVEYSQSIPISLKIKNGIFKYPLKSILYKYVPKEIMDRPKMGFGVPINEWLHKEFKDMVGDYSAKDFVISQDIFSVSGIENIYKHFKDKPTPALDRIMWCYLVFQLWWEEYIK